MAPYTMKIKIDDPVTEVTYVASARLGGDGYVTATGINVPSRTTANGATLLKDGGHEGLFMATFFAVEGCSKNLLVWSSMSALSGAEVIVLIAFVDASTCITSVPSIIYRDSSAFGLSDGKIQAPGLLNADSATFEATLAGNDKTYPDATATITIEAWSSITRPGTSWS